MVSNSTYRGKRGKAPLLPTCPPCTWGSSPGAPFLFTIIFILITLTAPATGHEIKRIVSLGPSITEELIDLGLGKSIVGCTTYCRLSELKGVERVGTVMVFDVERVVTLSPDIVFATPLADPRALKKLESLGIKVVTFSRPRSFKDVCKQFMELSRFVGRERKAREIISRVTKEVDTIRNKVKHLRKVKVFVEIGTKPLFTVRKGSFINDLVTFAGGKNVAEGTGSGIYSIENVLKKNPEVIIVVTMGMSGREKDMWLRFKDLEAVRKGRIYVVDSYKVCNPTPINFLKALREFAKILHPEVKL